MGSNRRCRPDIGLYLGKVKGWRRPTFWGPEEPGEQIPFSAFCPISGTIARDFQKGPLKRSLRGRIRYAVSGVLCSVQLCRPRKRRSGVNPQGRGGCLGATLGDRGAAFPRENSGKEVSGVLKKKLRRGGPPRVNPTARSVKMAIVQTRGLRGRSQLSS